MIDRKIDDDPLYEVHKCVVCNGFGTLKYGSVVCHSCNGNGFIVLDKITGRKVLSVQEEIYACEQIAKERNEK